MASEYFAAYRAMIGADDPQLDSLFASLEDRPDLFAQIDGRAWRTLPILVYEDRARVAGLPELRIWRPTVEIVLWHAIPGIDVAEAQRLVLTCGGFPGALEPMSTDMLSLASECSSYAMDCTDASNVIAMTTHFVRKYRGYVSQGATLQDICDLPSMRNLALQLHRTSVSASAAFQRGVVISVANLAPPPGARVLAPRAWLPGAEPRADNLPDWQPPPAIRVPHRPANPGIGGPSPSRSPSGEKRLATPSRRPPIPGVS